MLQQIGSRQLTEWMAFDKIDPIGGRRGDAHSAQLATMLANIFARRSGDPPFEIPDFMMEFGPGKQKTPDELYQMVRIWAILNGAQAPEVRAAPEDGADGIT